MEETIYITPDEQVTHTNFPELYRFRLRIESAVEFAATVETDLRRYELDGTRSKTTIPDIRRRKMELWNLLQVLGTWTNPPHVLIYPLRELYVQLGLAEQEKQVFLGGDA